MSYLWALSFLPTAGISPIRAPSTGMQYYSWLAYLFKTRKLSSIKDRGQTDRVFTPDLDLWPWVIIPCEQWAMAVTAPTHMQKIKAKGQSVRKIRVETDGQTHWLTGATALPPVLRRSVNILLQLGADCRIHIGNREIAC